MADEKSSISIKLGDAEFTAEGPVETVNAQFQSFLKALESTSQKRETAPLPLVQEAPVIPPSGEIDAQLLSRVFSKESSDRVSLKALPRSGSSDALLLLLYGFDVIVGQHAVTGSALMKAAEKSGVRVDRIDRLLAVHEPFVTTAGMRRGKRYGLNNRGKQHAIEILRAILG